MAFNPFDTFRKNSKPILAVVTIFIMFIFVLSSGIGGGLDFFDWVSRQFGGKDSRGEALGSLDGHEYHARELQEIRMKRAAANMFMAQSQQIADQQILGQLEQDVRNSAIKNQQTSQGVTAVKQIREILFKGQQLDPFQRLNLMMRYERMGTEMSQLADGIDAKENPNENRSARRLARIIGNDVRRFRDGGSYFNAVGNATDAEALQFAMYLTLADKMSVKFVDDDIKKMITEETEGLVGEKEASQLDLSIRSRYPSLSADQVFQTIGDEFRVMAALRILGGTSYSGRTSFPTSLTPFEFYQFYKDRCAEVNFEVVKLDVEAFIPKVKEEPTEKELKQLFDLYRKDESDPAREKPGFKEPRKVRIEYIGVDGTQAAYKNVLPVLDAVSTVAGGYSAACVGGGAVPGIMNVASPLIAEPLAVKEASESRLNFLKNRFDLYNTVWDPFLRTTYKPHDNSVYQPLPAAAFTAQLAVMTHPLGNLGSAVGAFRNLTDYIEARDRVKLGVPMFLAPFNPFGSWNAIGPALAAVPRDPVGVYEQQTRETLNERRPEWVAEHDLESLEKKLNDLRAELKPDEDKKDAGKKKETPKIDPFRIREANEKARALIDAWIKSHPAAETAASPFLLDHHRLKDDPIFNKIAGTAKDQPNVGQFVDMLYFTDPNEIAPDATLYEAWIFPEFSQTVSFLAGQAAAQARELLKFQSRRTFNFGRRSRDLSKPVYLAWKTEDRESKTYTKYEDLPENMKAEIIKAWKMQKARVLAKEAADELAKQVGQMAQKELKNATNEEAFVRGLRDVCLKDNYTLVPLELALLRKATPFHAESQNQPPAYEGPTIKEKQIPYAQPDMATKLLDVRNKPLGETVVMPDVPKSHYYVAVLTRKQEPSVLEFYNGVFRNTNVPTQLRRDFDTLYLNQGMQEAMREFRADLSGRLKAEAKYKETEELKKQADRPVNFEE